MWKVYQDSGRPWPTLCEDDLIDYMIMEAVFIKARKEESEAEKAAEKKEWKSDKSGFDALRAAAG